jgi:hypothetical protein
MNQQTWPRDSETGAQGNEDESTKKRPHIWEPIKRVLLGSSQNPESSAAKPEAQPQRMARKAVSPNRDSKSSQRSQQDELNKEFNIKLETIQEGDASSGGEATIHWEDFSRRIADIGSPDMYYSLKTPEGKIRVLSLAAKQRMNMYAIQRDLVDLASKVKQAYRLDVTEGGRDNDGESEMSQGARLKMLMHDYCERQCLT